MLFLNLNKIIEGVELKEIILKVLILFTAQRKKKTYDEKRKRFFYGFKGHGDS